LWQTVYEFAGIIGIEPDPFTLRELTWMAEGRMRERWNHTSLLWAAIAEPNRDRKKRSRPFEPADVHPYLRGARRARKPGGMALTPDVLRVLVNGPLKGKR
jgi:hypothetical protein